VWPKSRALARRVLSNTSTPLLKGNHVYSAKSGGELVLQRQVQCFCSHNPLCCLWLCLLICILLKMG
jgi:hypothetical protein